MLKDLVEEIRNDIAAYRGEDIPLDRVERSAMEINAMIFEDTPKIWTVGDFLRLYYCNLKENGSGITSDTPTYFQIRVTITGDDYKTSEPIELKFEKPLFQKKNPVKIGNLRRFLSDYQAKTNTWISAADLMNAVITDLDPYIYGRGGAEIRIAAKLMAE